MVQAASCIQTSKLFSKPAQERLQKKSQQMLDKIRGRRPADGVKLCQLTLENGEKGAEMGKLAFTDYPEITDILLNVREIDENNNDMPSLHTEEIKLS